jgi:hypothetical protein
MTHAQRLNLTPEEIAACVRLLGRGRSLVYCLRLIETQRAVLAQPRLTLDAAPRRPRFALVTPPYAVRKQLRAATLAAGRRAPRKAK